MTRPYMSGHCNASNPPEIHAQCQGGAENQGVWLQCSCLHHMAPDPVTDPGARLGVYDDLPELDYHADPTSLSASGMKDVLRSPAHYLHGLSHQKKTNAMDLGTITHRLLLGRGAEYVVLNPDEIGRKADGSPAASPASTTAWKEAVTAAEATGLLVLRPEQYAAAERMVDAVLTHQVAGPLFTAPGRSELSMFWHDPAFDVIRRCRWDRLTDTGIGIDLKTANNANPTALPKQIVDWGYELSAANYLAVAAGTGTEIAAYALVFVESAEPHAVVVAELGEDFLARGRALAAKALSTYRWCLDTGEWPAYCDHSFLTVHPPTWAPDADQITDTIPEGTAA